MGLTPFMTLTAPALALPLANVDTDQIIPARFMKRTRAEGYGDALLHDLRGPGGPAAALDDPAREGAAILVARRNFGAGSSREAAVYALMDAGFRAVLAPSFGDIFGANAAANGLLAAVLDEAAAEALIARLLTAPAEVTVDLTACTVRDAGGETPFHVDPVRRMKLLNGWDDLDLTDRHAADIAAWAEADRDRRPWARPAG